MHISSPRILLYYDITRTTWQLHNGLVTGGLDVDKDLATSMQEESSKGKELDLIDLYHD